MNMQLRQCFARVKPSDWKKARFCLFCFFAKNTKAGVEKKPEF